MLRSNTVNTSCLISTILSPVYSDLFSDEVLESKLEAVMAMSALLQGAYEVGGAVLGREGVLEMILAMADSGNAIHVVSLPLG